MLILRWHEGCAGETAANLMQKRAHFRPYFANLDA
jgi:hypothetical protein